MDSFEDVSDGEPPSIDPYEVLGLERSATADQIKSAYRKAALKHHPDKVPEDQKSEAHKTFQSIAFANAILSDPARRKRYDTTGSTSESIVDSDGFSWSDYYKEQFADAISAGAIAKIAEEYKKSDEEKDDVLAAYEQYKGRMDGIYSTVMLSSVLEDDERFRAIIDAAIASGEVPSFPAYINESKKSKQNRIKAAKREGVEAEEYAKKLGVHDKLFGSGKDGKGKQNGGGGGGGSSEDALAALIRKRQQDRGASFLDSLAEKYGAKPKKSKKRAAASEEDEEDDDEDADGDELSEEAFQAAAARLNKKKASAPKGKASKRSKR